jgi:hypothetical protein
MDKARLLAKGFQQKAGINHSNTFAHVVKWKTIWLFSALATHLQWIFIHLDVQIVFLNGSLI